jgi:hypothetical protein
MGTVAVVGAVSESKADQSKARLTSLAKEQGVKVKASNFPVLAAMAAAVLGDEVPSLWLSMTRVVAWSS